MSFRDLSDRHERVLQELVEERFASLTRIARTLEGQIAELRALRRRVETLDAGEGRQRAVHAYRALREQALRQRWYMDVQREVLGLRPHELVERFYEVPGPIA